MRTVPRIRKNEKRETARKWRVGAYTRLSRDDGDKPESDSIGNQRALLSDYIKSKAELEFVDWYSDDGYTGTNFKRPDFLRMVGDIEAGRIDCVLVKDLSRFGRDYIDMGNYLERWFPEHGVRFIAVNDGVDSERGPYDMLLPMKNIFNEHYARDISNKVKSAFQTKQRRGEFVGAFSSYGYRKDPEHHGRLIVDPYAAQVVQRIFDLFESGMGKVKIAKQLNKEGIPCPSEYKRLNGERYNNGRKIQNTTYWTYATIHRMLRNQMYIGNMEQGRSYRPMLKGKSKQLDRSQWTVVQGTHEAIISPEQWERVQALMQKDTRVMNFEQNVSPFAGFLRCGDCGRAMSKTNHPGGIYYCCGSYKRYGPTVCSRHGIAQRELEGILLNDLNHIIEAVGDLKELTSEASQQSQGRRNLRAEQERCQGALDRVFRLKKVSYEDYRDGLLSRDDYLQYKEDYERQEQQLRIQMAQLQEPEEEAQILQKPWVKNLLQHGKLTELDRPTLAETVEQILIFEDGRIEITYTFSDDLGILGTGKEDAG